MTTPSSPTLEPVPRPSTGGPVVPIWRCASFRDLTLDELDAIFRARQQVFVIEQACAYLDADGCDSASLHLTAWATGEALPRAYARIVGPGVKYPEPSIGRVLTHGPARGTGLGRALVRRAIEACRSAHPGMAIRISAQAQLTAFYADAGFGVAGVPYEEDGIPHIEMLWRPRPSG